MVNSRDWGWRIHGWGSTFDHDGLAQEQEPGLGPPVISTVEP